MLKANRIAIAGATGMVGQAFLKLLEKDFYPNAEIVLLASKKSKGKSLAFRGTELIVQDLAEYDFSGTDLALFSAGAAVSSQFAPKAVSQGCVVVDNSSCFRYQEDIPLIVPEVNGRFDIDLNILSDLIHLAIFDIEYEVYGQGDGYKMPYMQKEIV